MEILDTNLSENGESITCYADFWKWFVVHEQAFFETVSDAVDIDANFFDKLLPKLEQVHAGIFFLTGMRDADTAELVFTPNGAIKNIVFVEELVDAAPTLANWKFTALKPESDNAHMGIRMEGFDFDADTLAFYAIDNPTYPDEVNLVITHKDCDDDNYATIVDGVSVFMENYLGELRVATAIDFLDVNEVESSEQELIPITKLKDYLTWREKEFDAKYAGIRHDSKWDPYENFQATIKDGLPWISIMNCFLLNWENKVSHPWLLKVDISYKTKPKHGLADKAQLIIMNDFEEEIMVELKDIDGYLNIGRETMENKRCIYFACHEFRKPPKVMNKLIANYADKFDISYELYKDMYWSSLAHFYVALATR